MKITEELRDAVAATLAALRDLPALLAEYEATGDIISGAAERTLWVVGAYEKAIRGRVTHQRYVMIASSAEEAIRMARGEHQSEALPETEGARYVAEQRQQIANITPLRTISAKDADGCIAAGIS